MIKSDNKSRIHFYELHEFRQMVKDLSSKNDTFYDMFQRNFKSANNLPKSNLTMMSLGDLSKSNEKIEKLFELREKIASVSEDENLGIKTMIPFKTSKTIRKQAIKERLACWGISCDSFKYKQDFGYYRSAEEVQYPYFIEVFVGHSKADIKDNLRIIQSINSRISNDPMVFGGPFKFNFTDTEEGRKYRPANSILDILEYYKYSNDEKICKKPNSIFLINLISPRIDYRSQGKSIINSLPFSKVIPKTIEDACKGGSEKDGRPDQTKILEDILRERMEYYFALPQDNLVILKKHEWTNSDVFYAARKRLIEAGYTNEEINRK